MKAGKQNSFMEQMAAVIVDKRNVIFLIFAAAAIFCAFSRNWVRICDDITAYVGKIAPVIRLPGEEEMRSLAEGALRVLHGQQEASVY